MATRKNLNGIDTRALILSTSSQLFMEHGVVNTSLKDIAQAAGISTGTLFYYYASKSDLIFDVTDAHFDSLTQQLMDWVEQAYPQKDLQQVLQVVFETIVGDITRGRLHHYLIESAVSSEPSINVHFQQKYAEWLAMIESGLAHFIECKADLKIYAQVILAALDGLVIQAILGVAEIPIPQITARLAAAMQNPVQPTEVS